MIDEKEVPKRIRQLRLERKLTQQGLADAAGLTKGYISRIENASGAPPVGTLIALAQAMGVDFDDFFHADDSEAVYTVTRKDQRPPVGRDNNAPFAYEHLALGFPNRAFEPYIMKAEKTSQISQSNQHAGQEMIHVLRGIVQFNVNGETEILKEGDTIFFNSSYRHNGICLSENGAEILAVVWDGKQEKE